MQNWMFIILRKIVYNILDRPAFNKFLILLYFNLIFNRFYSYVEPLSLNMCNIEYCCVIQRQASLQIQALIEM